MKTWTEFLRTRRSMNIMGMTRKVCTYQWVEQDGDVALCKVDELRDQTQHDIYEAEDGRKFWRGACLG